MRLDSVVVAFLSAIIVGFSVAIDTETKFRRTKHLFLENDSTLKISTQSRSLCVNPSKCNKRSKCCLGYSCVSTVCISNNPPTNSPVDPPVEGPVSNPPVLGGILAPLYVYPTTNANGECTSPDYLKIANGAAASKTIAVVNPSNGPNYASAAQKAAYDACIGLLKTSGVYQVIGYVRTKCCYPEINSYRSYLDVVVDINMWHTDYSGIDGIFIDEVSNRWLNTSYDSLTLATTFNQNLTNHVLSLPNFNRVVMNPGSAYFEDIMAPFFGDARVTAVLFESQQAAFRPVSPDTCVNQLWTDANGFFPEGPWCPYVPSWDNIEPLKTLVDNGTSLLPSQNAVLMYASIVDATITQQVVTIGVNQKIGWFYVTDDGTNYGNPWDSTPHDTIMNALSSTVNNLL